MRFIHICSVPNTGSARWWPIVGRNDNRLYLALQTARELSTVSTLFLSILQPFFLVFLCLFSVLILSASLSLNGSSLHPLSPLLYLPLFSAFCPALFYLFCVLFSRQSLIFPLFLLWIFSLINISLPSTTWVRDTVKFDLSLLFTHNVCNLGF